MRLPVSHEICRVLSLLAMVLMPTFATAAVQFPDWATDAMEAIDVDAYAEDDAVTALDDCANESGSSNEASATPLAVPPAPPTNLVATAGNTQVALDWNDNTEPDLAGYNVYRGTTQGGPYGQINASLVTVSSYTDTGVTNGTTYYYVATAENTSAQEIGGVDHVVGANILGFLEPEHGRLVQDLSLERHCRQHVIEGRLAVGGDHDPPAVRQVVGFTDLAALVAGKFRKVRPGQAVGEETLVLRVGCGHGVVTDGPGVGEREGAV